jgi:hypothetical protein
MAKEEAKFDASPFQVVAKKTMHRAGRHWTAGLHDFSTKEQLAAIGDDKAIVALKQKLAVYPKDFELRPAAAKEPPAKN